MSFSCALEVSVPDGLLVPEEHRDQSQRFGGGRGFGFFGPLEVTSAMCLALGVDYLGIVFGGGGIGLIAIA